LLSFIFSICFQAITTVIWLAQKVTL
jgi:hypothetical protein